MLPTGAPPIDIYMQIELNAILIAWARMPALKPTPGELAERISLCKQAL